MNQPIQELISQVATDMVAGDFVGELVVVLKAEIVELDDGPALGALLEGSVTANIAAAVHFLVSDVEVAQLQVPPDAITHAEAAARAELELSSLIRAYRIGHARFLSAAMSRVAAIQEVEGSLTIIKIVNRAAQYIDKVCKEVEFAFVREQDRWLASGNGHKRSWVAQLVGGDAAAVDIAAAERAIGYRLDGIHLAVCVRPAAPEPRAAGSAVPAAALAGVRDLLASRLQSTSAPLTVVSDDAESWLWFTVPADLALDVSRLADDIAAAELDAQVALGGAGAGPDGFRRSHDQARVVLEIVDGAVTRAPATAYAQVASIALMSGDMARLRGFVGEVLGELAMDGERADRLRETLRAFLLNSRSFAAAAALLTVHRNTIQYRVDQALALCGRRLDDADEVLNIQIALQACHWLGAAVLRGEGELAEPRG